MIDSMVATEVIHSMAIQETINYLVKQALTL